MTPLPGPLSSGELIGWRLDQAIYATTWDSGEGAFRCGGRWNSKRVRAVYCSVDPATAIIEVAVHKTFQALDTVPHVITSFRVDDLTDLKVIQPGDVPNPNWLVPGSPSAGQQQFGDSLLASHKFVLIPSAVSRHSWNLLFDADRATGSYTMTLQERFALDGRLHPPSP
jgi:RES domain-containing protein